jgi:hypothetical protein
VVSAHHVSLSSLYGIQGQKARGNEPRSAGKRDFGKRFGKNPSLFFCRARSAKILENENSLIDEE